MHLIETHKWLLGAEPPTSTEDTHFEKFQIFQINRKIRDFVGIICIIYNQGKYLSDINFETVDSK